MRPDYIGIDFVYDGDTVVLNEIEDAVELEWYMKIQIFP